MTSSTPQNNINNNNIVAKTIVIDNGGGVSKMGLAGSKTPLWVFYIVLIWLFN